MCGIVGILGQKAVATDLVDALRRLEYRGYDSAGIATVENGHLERRRAEGKLRNLEGRLLARAADGAHRHRPHALGDARPPDRAQRASAHERPRSRSCTTASSRTSASCKAELDAKGHVFETDTDTEAVVHLITDEMSKGVGPVEAVRARARRACRAPSRSASSSPATTI